MVQFTVQYGQTDSNGKTLSKRNTANPPTVNFAGQEGKVYTLLMSDPDAQAKSWLHWLVINIPGESREITDGQVIANYVPPTPPSGLHNYIFTLYEQPAGSLMMAAPSERGNFQVKAFEQKFGLRKLVSRIVKVPANEKLN